MNFVRKKIADIIYSTNSEGNIVGKIYNSIMFVAIVMSLVPLAFRKETHVLFLIDSISCSLFILDYILRWLTADIRKHKSGFLIFLVYPFTPMAIIDLLSILPSVSVINSGFKVLRVSRMFKIFRVFKFVRYYEPLQLTLRVLNREKKILLMVLTFALLYIILIALIMFNIDEVNPATGEMVFKNFFEAAYWPVCTLTTIGYGDFYPVSTVGRIICMVSALLGIAIIALPSGAITSAYMEEIREKKVNQDQKADKDKV